MRLALALGVAIAPVAIPESAAAQQRHGDVSADGQVTALDAQAILSAVVGLPLPPSFVLSNGVSDCLSGRTTPAAIDAQIVLSFVIGLSTSQFCVGQSFGPGATTIALTLPDTSLLINRKLQLRAILRDDQGSLIERPVAWETSNADLVSVDSARGDTAWVSNHGVAFDAAATITAHADGTFRSVQIRVFRSYAGIVIVPQRGDTLKQLNGITNFHARNRDSLGVLGAFPNVFWTVGDVSIATAQAAASNTGTVTALTTGSTWLYAELETNRAVRDSVRITVALPPLNVCTGTGGTLHNTQTFAAEQVWSPATNPHYVNGTLTFASGSRLTVHPGTLVCLTSGAHLYFQPGSRMTAIGTVTDTIRFMTTDPGAFWSGIQFGDFTSHVPEPTDTSRIQYAAFSRGNNFNGTLNGRERHVVLLENVVVRQSNQGAVSLASFGSQMIRSRIDTVLQNSTSFSAAFIGRGSIEETSIRVGSASLGVTINDAGLLRQVTIVGGTTAISQSCCGDSTRINDVSISGASGVALDLAGSLLHPASSGIQITGGSGGGFRGQIGNFAILFPDATSQNALNGLGRDTVFITGGSAFGVALAARADLPWLMSTTVIFDAGSQLIPEPGTRFGFASGAFIFRNGGTLTAVGTPTAFIQFGPATPSFPGSTFGGLAFETPPANPNPALNPIVTSTLTYVRLDSASGVSAGSCCSAIGGADRHKVVMDSVIVRASYNGAVYLNEEGSELKRSVVDLTGNIGSSFTTGFDAVQLGNGVLMENTLVRQTGNTLASGAAAVNAFGTGVTLRGVVIRGSLGRAFQAEQGIIATSPGGVKTDSANAFPFRGRIENLAALAPTAALQTASFLGGLAANGDDRLEITGGTVTGSGSVLTIEATPQLRWQMSTSVIFDALTQLVPQPGSRFTFASGAFHFRNGGILTALGTSAQRIRFEPTITGGTFTGTFNGLAFETPPANPNPALNPIATSTLSYVRLDSASGVSAGACCSAIGGADRHRVLMDSVIVRGSWNGAVYLNEEGSELKNSFVDLTGNIGQSFQTSFDAVQLGNSVLMENTLVRQTGNTLASGAAAVNAFGTGVILRTVTIRGSLGRAFQAEQGIIATSLGGVKTDSANAFPFRGRIENLAALAPSATQQIASFIGSVAPNLDNRLEITGGTATGSGSVLTIEATPQLRWQMSTSVVFDALTQLVPQPGSQFTFASGAFHFRNGGTLTAVGTPTQFIRFQPTTTGQTFTGTFNGLAFETPPANPNPQLNPIATSTLTYVRLDSASGVSVASCCSAIGGGDRHKVIMDSVVLRASWNGAVYLHEEGSELKRSFIDLTGNIGSSFTTSFDAVQLGNSVLMENTLVRQTGNTLGSNAAAVNAFGTGVTLRGVVIRGSLGRALQAEQGIIATSLGGVKTDSANAFPFRGRLENLAALAASGAQQNASFLGSLAPNLDDRLEITNGVLASATPLTVEATPQLRWQVSGNPVFDAQTTFAPQPASNITFTSSGMIFRNGGILSAVGGAQGQEIIFRPAAVSGASFSGLQFDNPDAASPAAISVLQFVQIDSATGMSPAGGACCAALSAGNRHALQINNLVANRSINGAVYLFAPGSTLANSLVQITGGGAGTTTGFTAVVLGSSTSATNTTIRRSGGPGLDLQGTSITLTGTRIVSTVGGAALQVQGGSQGGSFSGFAVDSSTNVGVSVQVPNVQLSGFVVDHSTGVGVSVANSTIAFTGCDVLRGATHGFALTGNHVGVQIHDCNIGGDVNLLEQNLGQGVFNPGTNTNVVDAVDNWWGIDVTGANLIPVLGGVNGFSGLVTVSPQRPSKRIP